MNTSGRAGRTAADTNLYAAAGVSWVLSLIAAYAFPWLFPVLVLVILFPLVWAIPDLDARRLRGFLAVGLTTLAAAGVIAISNDDGGLIADIDDVIELVLIAGGLVAIGLLIGLTIRRSNDAHRRATLEAVDSRRRLVGAADEERAKIERDLHDGVQQQFVACGIELRRLSGLAGDDGPLGNELRALAESLGEATSDLRSLAHGIYPPLLEAQGLAPALKAAARRAANTVTVDATAAGRFGRSIESAVYFCALEALANADKHAAESSVSLRLTNEPDLVLEVSDDGPGMSGGTTQSRGLINLADRMAAVGGTFEIDSSTARGTTLRATVPADVLHSGHELAT